MGFRLATPIQVRLRNGKFGLTEAISGGGDPPLGAATSMAVNNIVDKDGRVIQRDIAATSKTVEVSGSYTGNPVRIEVCTVRAIGGVPITTWTTLVENPTGGTFSAPLVIPQGPYQGFLKVRCGTNAAIGATTSLKFAVGVVVAMPGQSNLRFVSEQVLSYPLVNLNNRRYRVANGQKDWQHHGNYDATGTFPPGTPSSTYGGTRTLLSGDRGDGIAHFTNNLSAILGCAVGTLEVSVTGSAMATWLPGSGANWTTLETALAESGGDAEYWVHLQGENDASGSTTDAAWQAGAQSMLNRAMVLTGRDASQLHWGSGLLGTATAYAPEGRFGVIRGAQLAFVAANTNTFMLGCFIEAPISDSVHYSASYRARQGRVMAHTLAAKAAGAPKTGPKITGWSRTGTSITITVGGGVGALKDGSGGTGTSLQGFRFFDSGIAGTDKTAAHTVVGISGNTIQFTLNSAVLGTISFDFGMANAPFGATPAAASILYDSDSILGESLGMTLQSFPLTTIP